MLSDDSVKTPANYFIFLYCLQKFNSEPEKTNFKDATGLYNFFFMGEYVSHQSAFTDVSIDPLIVFSSI